MNGYGEPTRVEQKFWLIDHHDNISCHDSDSQDYNIMIVSDMYAMSIIMHNSKDNYLKFTNSSDSYCVGRQSNNDRRRNITLDYIEGSIRKLWEHL